MADLADLHAATRISSIIPQDSLAGTTGDLITFQYHIKIFLVGTWLKQKFPDLRDTAREAVSNALDTVSSCRSNIVSHGSAEESSVDRSWITVAGQPHPETCAAIADFGADLIFSDEYWGSLKVALKNRKMLVGIFEYPLIKDGANVACSAYDK